MQVRRLFGELEAEHAGMPVPIRGVEQRALLSPAGASQGNPVSADRLIDARWGDGQAAHPVNALQPGSRALTRPAGR
jgi:DNA-binding SARP family transcriptional activator